MNRLPVAVLAASFLALLTAAPAVAAPPPNDDFVNATAFPTAGGTFGGDTTEATSEAGEPPASSGPNTSLWYTWTPFASTRVTMHTCGSALDTTLSVSTGSPVNALTPVSSNDQDAGGYCDGDVNTSVSRLVFNAVGGTTYRIAVDGFQSQSGTFKVSVVPHTLDTTMFDPGTIDFGTQPLATIGAARMVRLVNISGSPVTVDSMRVSGGSSTDLGDDYLLTANDCTGATLAPDQACHVRLRFAPTATGSRRATLVFGMSSGGRGLFLDGTGGEQTTVEQRIRVR
jgi:hypothetical protein